MHNLNLKECSKL
jgi:hypothetical protein